MKALTILLLLTTPLYADRARQMAMAMSLSVQPAAASVVVKPVADAPTQLWMHDYDARATGKRTFFVVHNHPNCAACVLADKVLNDTNVLWRMKLYQWVYVDADYARRAGWEIGLYPALVSINPETWEVADVMAFPTNSRDFLYLLSLIEEN